MAKKVYAIQYGFDIKNNKKVENIIVNTWAECLSYVKGVKGAKYKSFEDINEANMYLSDGSRMLKKSDANYPQDCLHVYVDGSYNSSDERYSYGVVCVRDNVVKYIESGAEKDTSEKNIRQIAGELKGAVRAVEYAAKIGEKRVVIFHDYEGIAHHATGAWERKESSSMKYYDKMQELMNSGIEVIFVKVDSHTGDLFNELVDEKCKECLGIPSDRTVEKYLSSNVIIAADEETKEKIAALAPNNYKNIVIDGCDEGAVIIENNKKEKKVKESLSEEMFKEITDLYREKPKEAKKRISKMLSKDREKYILYLLDLK